MFSRRVPPTHCHRGSDSIGRHNSRELIASSASRGVMSVPACMLLRILRRTWVRLRTGSRLAVLRLEDFQLLVEAANVRLQFVDRRVVLLSEDLELLLNFLLLISRKLGRVLGSGLVDLLTRAIEVCIHLRVVPYEIMLGSDHLFLGRRVAVRRRLRRGGVGAVGARHGGGSEG